MSKPLLIVVTGLPCTGKTTLGRYLARELKLPYIHKDGIKETLFNSLGWHDRQWSRKLGAATYDLMDYLLDVLMQAGVSFIVESNFHPETAGPTLANFADRYSYDAIQLLCKADGRSLVERFRSRSESSDRHAGHVDASNYEEMEPQLLKGRLDPLPLPGLLIEVDTTDLDMVDYDSILESVREAITHERGQGLDEST